ncbi:hypothetical protein BJ684DRAFT_15525 [Piptocephalis cylindrospora]|uniref:Uncharacterized protein n=1 Tax=Piptocephalis cylindrospora TaxID=1907219 RepID=A0A4P9Y5V6_9FUNG|nr:hypothetical protein BJ684DRAFT_15525 [Piptocephalis cylindrospora]|eukprot:RKP14132.1 hypothetical protein BJ684DRAFT_15525 [Piptocephalis cylindrospora]
MSFTGKDTTEDHHLLPQLIPALTSSKPPGGLRVESAQVGRELTKLRPCDSEGCLYCREWAFLLGRRLLRAHASSNAPVSLTVLGAEPSSSGKAPPTGSLKPRSHISSLVKDLAKQEEFDAFLATLTTWMSQCPLAVVQASTIFLPVTLDERTLDSSPAHDAAVLAHAQYTSSQLGSTEEKVSGKKPLVSTPFSSSSASSTSSTSSSVATPTLSSGPEESSEDILHTSALCLLSQALTVDKRGVGLTEDDMPLLGALGTKSLLLDLVSPTCHHRRGKDRGPADLAHEGKILNEILFRHGKADADTRGKAAQPAWEPVRALIRSFQQIARDFAALRQGPGMPTTSGSLDAAGGQGVGRVPGWNDVFGPVAEAAKKKGKGGSNGGKGGADTENLVQELDDAATTYLQGQASSLSSYHEEVLKPRVVALCGLWERILESTQMACAALNVPLSETHIEGRVKESRRVLTETEGQLADHLDQARKTYEEDARGLKEVYFNETKATPTGRMERAASKEFRKMTRRLEVNQAQARSKAITLLLDRLDDAPITRALLDLLPPLLTSMEAREEEIFLALGLENRATLRSLVQKRQRLEGQYRTGIRQGQRTVGLTVGRLLLREGRRVLELQKAERKGDALLETIGAGEGSEGKKQKKKKKKLQQQLAKAKDTAEGEEAAAIAAAAKREEEERRMREEEMVRKEAEKAEKERKKMEMEKEKGEKEEEERRKEEEEAVVAARKLKEAQEATKRIKQVPVPVTSPTVVAWPKAPLTPKIDVKPTEVKVKEEAKVEGKKSVKKEEGEVVRNAIEKVPIESPTDSQPDLPTAPPPPPFSLLHLPWRKELTRTHQHVLALQERCQHLADTCRALEGGLRERDALLAAALDREAAAVRDACAAGNYVGNLERRLHEAERLLHLHSMSGGGSQSPSHGPGGSNGPWSSPSGTPNGGYGGGFEFSSPPPSFSQSPGPNRPGIEGTMTPPTQYSVSSGGGSAVEEAAKRLETELFDESSITHRDGSYRPSALSLRSRIPSGSGHGSSPAMSPRSPRSPGTMMPPPGMMGSISAKPLGKSPSNGLLRHLPLTSPSSSSPSSPTTSTGGSSSFLASAGSIGPGVGVKAAPPGLPASPTSTNSSFPFRRPSATPHSNHTSTNTTGNWRAGSSTGQDSGSWRSRGSSPELAPTLPRGTSRGTMRSTLKCANCGISGHRSDEVRFLSPHMRGVSIWTLRRGD